MQVHFGVSACAQRRDLSAPGVVKLGLKDPQHPLPCGGLWDEKMKLKSSCGILIGSWDPKVSGVCVLGADPLPAAFISQNLWIGPVRGIGKRLDGGESRMPVFPFCFGGFSGRGHFSSMAPTPPHFVVPVLLVALTSELQRHHSSFFVFPVQR